ncbi:sensor histidine kinase [Aliigemmobacter aestuarii]|uniref:C4-dicarboxylate transport sensor protein DctB n=1 Tax=Aliigemmobacter aestuarii TaxID=1445661 RepID=A0A4S3MMS2_9RHOB|nr:ATP-binding protein [Gemmobacter aestuarii]THD82981.1 sensor histidine kinase [Gemmobacter aestuarii]
MAFPGLSRPLALALTLGAILALTGAVWWVARDEALGRLRDRAQSDLTLASDRLGAQLARYRELAVLLTEHPTLRARLYGFGAPDGAQAVLQGAADRTGSLEIALLDESGTVLSSSRPAAIGLNAAGSAHFRRAMEGALGFRHEVDPDTGQRAFVFAAPMFLPEGPARGAVTVRFSVDRVESNWRAAPETVFFTDAAGIVLVANRSELVFATRLPEGPMASPAASARAVYPAGLLHPFVPYSARLTQGHDLWTIDGGPYLPRKGLHLERDVPTAGLTAEIIVDAGPALRVAALQALATGAMLSAAAFAVAYLLHRRRALAERLKLEAAVRTQLEDRVAARTRDLSSAVDRLRAEVAEREEAEAALRRAQSELIQAGKLSALGQMSAGISHELNQPLMAIRSYAENAQRYLEQDKPGTAAENLGRISDLAHRMGRIIRNLRAFARAESEPLSVVDLVGVVQAVLEMTEPRIERAGVTLDWQPPGGPAFVHGGEVRLQQVVLNLVSNALDAMEGQEPPRRLILRLAESGDRTTLTVADTGPGLKEPDRVFDPFYSTKEVGQAEGMGLGLSISFRIVESFDGRLSGGNRPEGGAIFRVELRAARAEKAA